MDRSDHHPVLLLRLRRREQLGLGRRKLGRLRRLQQQRMRLWLRLRWMQRRMRVQLQLQLRLRMQRLLLLITGATYALPGTALRRFLTLFPSSLRGRRTRSGGFIASADAVPPLQGLCLGAGNRGKGNKAWRDALRPAFAPS